MNILLNDPERETYKDAIAELSRLCPETILRKIPKANVQQAFVFDMVKKLCFKNDDILCVGSYEDTACESLKAIGYRVTDIDPAINCSLDEYFISTFRKFDVIFSTSVMEHVGDDEIFIDQICKLLKLGGHAVITCDFNNDYIRGGAKPSEDMRLYTKHDLLGRLNNILIKNGCSLIGDINYDAKPDFQYSGHTYSFATYVFRKG